MFKVLKIDGPHLVTDKGCIAVVPFQYAGGGKTGPVSLRDAERFRRLFAAAPELLASLREMVAAMLAHASLGLNEQEAAMLQRADAALRKAEVGE